MKGGGLNQSVCLSASALVFLQPTSPFFTSSGRRARVGRDWEDAAVDEVHQATFAYLWSAGAPWEVPLIVLLGSLQSEKEILKKYDKGAQRRMDTAREKNREKKKEKKTGFCFKSV